MMNNVIICPYCGYEFSDSDSVFEDRAFLDSMDIQCPDCDETFECERIIRYKTYVAYEEGNS